MSTPYLHIVSLNVPFPADYGGVVDIFYKIRALKQAGARVILHCFEYGRQPSKELEELCFKVFYYPRRSGLAHLLRSDPYIVSTRNANSMPENMLRDPFPVLFEGLHTTGILSRCREARKKVLVRTHNIEHAYYRALSKSESALGRKIFLRWESGKLMRYEKVLSGADHILGISRNDTTYFQNKYGNALYIPVFHRFDEVTSLSGKGDYLLIHGNMGVPENSTMVMRLLKAGLDRTRHRIIVAGKNPGGRLRRRLSGLSHIRLVADPDDRTMEELILNAQVNLLYTGQSTGMKLKLIHALFAGRHCLVNPPMVEGSGLEKLCRVSGTGEQLMRDLENLMELPFDPGQIRERKKALAEFSNRAGAEKIIRLLS